MGEHDARLQEQREKVHEANKGVNRNEWVSGQKDGK